MAAEDTAAILHQAAHGGVPLMIPGAFEIRVARPTNATLEPVTPHARRATVGDWERLEREREGGGAPSQRKAGRHGSILARLWHRVVHPGDLPIVRRQPLPEEN
jgi:hypothetical protein